MHAWWGHSVTRIFLIVAFLAFISSGPSFSGWSGTQVAATAASTPCTTETTGSGATVTNCNQHVDKTVDQNKDTPQVVSQGDCTNDNIKTWSASSDKTLQQKAQACQARTGKLTFKDENGNLVEIPMTDSQGLAEAAAAQAKGIPVSYQPAGSSESLPLGKLPTGIENLSATQQLQSVLSNAYNQDGPLTAGQKSAQTQALEGLVSLAGDGAGAPPTLQSGLPLFLSPGLLQGAQISDTSLGSGSFNNATPAFTPSVGGTVSGTTFGTPNQTSGINAAAWDPSSPLGGVTPAQAGTISPAQIFMQNSGTAGQNAFSSINFSDVSFPGIQGVANAGYVQLSDGSYFRPDVDPRNGQIPVAVKMADGTVKTFSADPRLEMVGSDGQPTTLGAYAAAQAQAGNTGPLDADKIAPLIDGSGNKITAAALVPHDGSGNPDFSQATLLTKGDNSFAAVVSDIKSNPSEFDNAGIAMQVERPLPQPSSGKDAVPDVSRLAFASPQAADAMLNPKAPHVTPVSIVSAKDLGLPPLKSDSSSPSGPTIDQLRDPYRFQQFPDRTISDTPQVGEPYTASPPPPASTPTKGNQSEPSSITTAPSGGTKPVRQADSSSAGGTAPARNSRPSPSTGGTAPSGASQSSPIKPIIDALKTLASYIPQAAPSSQQPQQQQPSPQQQQGVTVPQGQPLPAPSQDNPAVITTTVPSADTVAPASTKQSAIDTIAFIADSPLQQQAAPTDKCAGLADPFICKYGLHMGLGAPKEDTSPTERIENALQQLQNAKNLGERAAREGSPSKGTQSAAMAKDAADKLAKAAGDVASARGVSPADKKQLEDSAAQAQKTAKQILDKVRKWDYDGVEDLSKKLGQQATGVAGSAKKIAAAAATLPGKTPEATPPPVKTASPAPPSPQPASQEKPAATPPVATPPQKTTPPSETRTASCPGNNCSGIKAEGVALEQIKKILQGTGGKVGSQTPNQESYATFDSPAQWLVADVVKRIAYCVQNGHCTIGQQDAQWATPDRDHPTLNRLSRSFAVASGYLQKDPRTLGPDDVRKVLETKIDPEDVDGIMRVSVGVVCAEYSLCSSQFISEADKAEARKILAANGIGTGVPTSPAEPASASRAFAPAATPGEKPAAQTAPGTPPNSPQDVLKDFAQKQNFIFGQNGKLLTPEEAGKLSPEERSKLDVYEPTSEKNADTHVGDISYQRVGTVSQYVAQQQRKAQAALENAVRDRELNQLPQLQSVKGSGALVTEGSGIVRPVYQQAADGARGQQVGQVRTISDADAKLRAAAQMRGVQAADRDGQLFTQDGKRLELRSEGTKVVPSAPKHMVSNPTRYGSTGRVAQAAGAALQAMTHDQWVNALRAKGVNVQDLSSQTGGAAARRGATSAVAVTIHGDVAGGDNLVAYEARQLAAGRVAAQAVLKENGTLVILQRLDTFAAHAASMNGRGWGVETAGADGGREATDAQFSVQKAIADVAFSNGQQIATHGQAEPGHRDLREAGMRIVNYIYGNGPVESPQVGLYAVDETGGASRVGDIIDSGALAPARGGAEFLSTNAAGQPDGNLRVALSDLPDVGKVTTSLATDPDGNKLGINYDYTPPPLPPPPPGADTRSLPQRIADGFRQTMQKLFGQRQPKGGGSGGGSGGSSAQRPPTQQTPGLAAGTSAQLSCVPQTIANGSSVAIAWACPTGSVAQFDGFFATSTLTGSTWARVATTSSSVSFGLRCIGAQSVQPLSCTVAVLHPQVTLVAKPELAQKDEAVHLEWSAVDITACRLYAPPGILLMSGTNSGNATTLPLTRSAIFRIMCDTSAFTSVFGSVTVKVSGDTQAPLDTQLPRPAIAPQPSVPVSFGDQIPVSSQLGPSNGQPDGNGATAACDPESPTYISCLESLMLNEDKLY